MSDARRKVLFFFPFPSLGGGGGAQRVLSTLLRHLDHDSFELHLALLQARRTADDEIPAGIAVHDLAHSRVRYSLLSLIALVRRVRPTVVFSNIGQMNVALLLCRPFLPRGTRVVIGESTSVNAYLQESRKYPKLWAAMYRALYKGADAVICLSDAMKRELAEHFSVASEKMVRIYNPVDVDAIRGASEIGGTPFDQPGPHLVAAGRFVREKGIDLLLDGMPRVLAALPSARLTLLGEGPLEQDLRRQTQVLKLEHAITFAGLQQNPWRYFRHASVVVVPSRLDGLPYVPLEARAVGTPVIATDCPGGIREAIEDDGIALVKPEDPGALADAIISTLRRGPAQANPSRLAKFSVEQAVEGYSAVFNGK